MLSYVGRGQISTEDGVRRVVALRQAALLLDDPLSEPAEIIRRITDEMRDDIGDSVGPSSAARTLGVSTQALSHWMDEGLLAVVQGPNGRRRIPLGQLEDLTQRVTDLREQGRDRGALVEALRQQAADEIESVITSGIPGESLAGEGAGGHRPAELRSLEMHRLIAERLTAEIVARAKERVGQWLEDGRPVHPYWAQQWQRLLERPVDEIRELLAADTQEMRDLRQATPFAGVLDESERRQIIEEIA